MGEQQTNNPLPDLGKAINWHKLIFTKYEYKDILEIKLTQSINEHATLHISGTLKDTAGAQNKDYVQTTEQNTPVDLKYIDGTGQEKYLFRGVVTNIKQRVMAGLKYLDIEAISFSYLLDIIRQSRSFQREEEAYSYIFERINKRAREYIPNLKEDVVKAEGNQGQQITGKLIIQYNESDWDFLKRLASNLNIGLTPDITFCTPTPKIYFGLPPVQTPQENHQDDKKSEENNKQEEVGPEFNASTYHIRRDTAAFSAATTP